MFPETGKAVVRVLERLGHTVEFRAAQTCCGQMHFNTGYHPEAVSLVRHFLDVFEGAEIICVPSSSVCRDDSGQLSKIARELEILCLPARWKICCRRSSNFPSCWWIGWASQTWERSFRTKLPCTRRVIRCAVCEWATSLFGCSKRCAAWSSWSSPKATNAAASAALFPSRMPRSRPPCCSDKIRAILGTRAEVCTATDNSCLMHIGGALGRQNAGVRCMHLAEILAAAGAEAGS